MYYIIFRCYNNLLSYLASHLLIRSITYIYYIICNTIRKFEMIYFEFSSLNTSELRMNLISKYN